MSVTYSRVTKIVEIKTNSGIKRYSFVDSDIDTVMVRSMDGSEISDGFHIIYRHNSAWKEEMICKIVRKADVAALYSDRDKTEEFFGSMDACFHEKNGCIKVEVHKPTEFEDEFTYEEYMVDRGGNPPPVQLSRYYLLVDKDDKRLKTITTYIHTDHIIDVLPSNISEHELKEKAVQFVVQKLLCDVIDARKLYSLLMGCYGYRIPHKLLSTDIDLVFEKVIPDIYSEYKTQGKYAGQNFCRNLLKAIVYEKWFIGENIIIQDGIMESPSPEYRFFMKLQFHLKLKELHKKGIMPYTELDLKDAIHKLEEGCTAYFDKHIAVLWNQNVVCEDIGKYAERAIAQLSYF